MNYETQQEFADSLGVTLEELASKLPCYAPRCNGHFVVRKNRKNGDVFFGCSRFPECHTTRRAEDVEDEVTATIIGHVDPDEPHYSKW